MAQERFQQIETTETLLELVITQRIALEGIRDSLQEYQGLVRAFNLFPEPPTPEYLSQRLDELTGWYCKAPIEQAVGIVDRLHRIGQTGRDIYSAADRALSLVFGTGTLARTFDELSKEEKRVLQRVYNTRTVEDARWLFEKEQKVMPAKTLSGNLPPYYQEEDENEQTWLERICREAEEVQGGPMRVAMELYGHTRLGPHIHLYHDIIIGREEFRLTDSITKEPILYNPSLHSSYEWFRAHGAPIPDTMQNWIDRGLLTLEGPEHGDGFMIVDIDIPVIRQIFQQRVSIVLGDQDETELPTQYDPAYFKKFYLQLTETIAQVFSEVDVRIHPEIEMAAKRLATIIYGMVSLSPKVIWEKIYGQLVDFSLRDCLPVFEELKKEALADWPGEKR